MPAMSDPVPDQGWFPECVHSFVRTHELCIIVIVPPFLYFIQLKIEE